MQSFITILCFLFVLYRFEVDMSESLPKIEKDQIRFYIWMRYKLGETQIHGDLNRVIGEEAPSFETVCRRIRSFADLRLSFEDEERCGRP